MEFRGVHVTLCTLQFANLPVTSSDRGADCVGATAMVVITEHLAPACELLKFANLSARELLKFQKDIQQTMQLINGSVYK